MSIKDNKLKNIKGPNQKTIRVITINTLKEEMEIFSSKYIDYFFQKGFNKNSSNFSSKNILCLFPKNKSKKHKRIN